MGESSEGIPIMSPGWLVRQRQRLFTQCWSLVDWAGARVQPRAKVRWMGHQWAERSEGQRSWISCCGSWRVR